MHKAYFLLQIQVIFFGNGKPFFENKQNKQRNILANHAANSFDNDFNLLALS